MRATPPDPASGPARAIAAGNRVDPQGRPCPCGSRGCLNVETDALSLIEAAGRRPRPGVPVLEQATALLRDVYTSDVAVQAATSAVIERLGLGLAGLINVLNPDRILLGGLPKELHAAAGPR